MSYKEWTIGNKTAVLTFDSNIRKWALGLKFTPRITSDIYDVNILWPRKMTPTDEQALAKAEEILKQEWV